MTGKQIVCCCFLLLLSTVPAVASQVAVVPAYAPVSANQSDMQAYQDYLDNHNRAAALRLLRSDKVFRSPKDVKVEVVTMDKGIAQVKMNRLDGKAQPITFFFWTTIDQLKLMPVQPAVKQ